MVEGSDRAIILVTAGTQNRVRFGQLGIVRTNRDGDKSSFQVALCTDANNLIGFVFVRC